MAISFDFANSKTVTSTTVITWSHTCASHSILVMACANTGGGTISGTPTYNGVAMTQLVANVLNNPTYLYILLNPASGTNTISATFTGGAPLMGASISLKGADTVVGKDATGSGQGAVDPVSTTINVNSVNEWTIDYANIATSLVSGLTPTGGQTQKINQNDAVNGVYQTMSIEGPWSSTGSKSLSYTGSLSHNWQSVGCSIKVGPVISTSHRLTLLGVGT